MSIPQVFEQFMFLFFFYRFNNAYGIRRYLKGAWVGGHTDTVGEGKLNKYKLKLNNFSL